MGYGSPASDQYHLYQVACSRLECGHVTGDTRTTDIAQGSSAINTGGCGTTTSYRGRLVNQPLFLPPMSRALQVLHICLTGLTVKTFLRDENVDHFRHLSVVWCGVWCGVVWCGVVWYGVVQCGAVWCRKGEWIRHRGSIDPTLQLITQAPRRQ